MWLAAASFNLRRALEILPAVGAVLLVWECTKASTCNGLDVAREWWTVDVFVGMRKQQRNAAAA
jgi:hypothetical protein